MTATRDAVLPERLRALGLPLVLEPRVRLRAMLRRSAGATTLAAIVLLGFAAIDKSDSLALDLMERTNDTEFSVNDLRESDPIFALLLVGLGLWLASPVIAWLVARAAKRARPLVASTLGLVSAAALLIGPVVGFGTRVGPDPLTTAAVLAAILISTFFGVGTILRWSGRRVIQELWTLGPMVARVLPVLMIAFLFFFYNAEIWQVMVALSWERTWCVVGTMAVLAIGLTIMTTRDELRSVLEEHAEEQARTIDRGPSPLTRSERVNLLLIPSLVILIQSTLFALLVGSFFVFFGWLSVPDPTVAQWTGQPVTRFSGLASSLPVTPTLVKVSVTLAAFSALNFVASASSDRQHRSHFLEPLLDEVVHSLEVRDAYVDAYATERAALSTATNGDLGEDR